MTVAVGLRMIESWPRRRTALIHPRSVRGMAVNGGAPVPVRALAQSTRLIREARQLPFYGIAYRRQS